MIIIMKFPVITKIINERKKEDFYDTVKRRKCDNR